VRGGLRFERAPKTKGERARLVGRRARFRPGFASLNPFDDPDRLRL
jgi:hypothetical protein